MNECIRVGRYEDLTSYVVEIIQFQGNLVVLILVCFVLVQIRSRLMRLKHYPMTTSLQSELLYVRPG